MAIKDCCVCICERVGELKGQHSVQPDFPSLALYLSLGSSFAKYCITFRYLYYLKVWSQPVKSFLNLYTKSNKSYIKRESFAEKSYRIQFEDENKPKLTR